MNETQYQASLIKKIEKLFPECIVLRNDPRHIQGIPDILILFEDKWAMLEVKLSQETNVQPNQAYYVELLGSMSFASFIYPENEEDVLDALQSTLGLRRKARIS